MVGLAATLEVLNGRTTRPSPNRRRKTHAHTISHWIDNKPYAGSSGATAPVTNPATGKVPGMSRWPASRMPVR